MKGSHRCHHIEDVESLPSILFPGFSTSSHHLFHRTCRLIALGEWLRADVVSALSFEAGAGRSSQLLRAAAMSFCFFQSPIAGVPVAANGDPVRGRVVMKQSKKGLHLKRPTRRLPRARVASTPRVHPQVKHRIVRRPSSPCPAECPQFSRSSRLQWWAPTWIEVTGEGRTCIWNISAPASRSTPLGPGRLVLPCPPSTFDGGAKAEKRGRCRGGVGCPR